MKSENHAELVKKLEAAEKELGELRKAAEELNIIKEKLKESEEKYRRAFEFTGTAMIVIDEDMTVVMANHKLEEITGYSQEEILKRRKWTEVVVPEDVEWMKEYHLKRRREPDNVPTEYEFRLIDSKGKIRDMLLNATMLPGTKLSLVSLVDITKLKNAERALRESEKRYRDLFENATDIIFTIDLEGNFTSANKSALFTFGYTEEDVGKTNIRQLIDPEWYDFTMKKLAERRSLKAPSDRYEILARKKDGTPVWIELSTRIIREGEDFVGIQGIARDITERKKYEEELKESQQRFKEIADLLPAVICETDLSLRITYVNEMGLSTFGFTHEDFEKGIYVWDLIPENELEIFKQDFFNVTHGDYGNPKLYELYRKDKTKLQVILNSAPLIKDNKVVGVRSCLIDISDRVRAEKQLRESEERFRLIYKCSPIGIALYTIEGNLIDSNDSFKTMFSDVKEGLVDFLFDIVKIDKGNIEELMEGKMINKESEIDIEKENKSKQKLWFEWYISPLTKEGSTISILLVQVQDITARKEAQEARLQKEREAIARAEALIAGLQKELKEYTGFRNIVSRSQEMKQIFDILPEVAQANATVLIVGESGTGKELIARSLHELSDRKDKPFIAINCSALPENLLESELFGYKAGAFTDAKKDKPGKFAAAEGGTIFLDEIGDIPPSMQVKLLRVLQERVYEPLGSTTPMSANVRVIAATNRDLQRMVMEGTFREDLFYRINVVTIQLPPLRDRKCDIPLLCRHFIEKFNIRYNKKIEKISNEALDLLMSHDFPGNIRELENIIEHAFIFCKSDSIETTHLPPSFRQKYQNADAQVFAGIKSFDELERLYIKSVLSQCGGNKLETARRLGIHKATLFRKLKQLGIK
ncbi:MAG: PAS domain S-box protein [Chitinispirillaceae bacterium]|nr:PAS domain S-box protein [Chitinispirillaceae bacterium]